MGLSDLFKKGKKQTVAEETTPYNRIGGEVKVRELANCFYDIMEQDPYAAELLAIHPQPLERIREVFFLYLSLWLGGPDTYQQQFGHPRLRARHLPFSVTPELKAQWMYCMRKAMLTTVDDMALANNLLASLDTLADHMINAQ